MHKGPLDHTGDFHKSHHVMLNSEELVAVRWEQVERDSSLLGGVSASLLEAAKRYLRRLT